MKRDDIQKWAKVASRPLPKLHQENAVPLLLRDIAEVRRLEDLLLLHRGDFDRCEEVAADISRKIFGISDYDTRFKIPSKLQERLHYSPESGMKAWGMQRAHESQFDNHDNRTEEEIVDVMLKFGFDFRDDRRQPLRCTKFLCRPAEAAAKGICGGKMPDRKEIDVKQFAARMEQEAREFLANKRKR